MRKMKPQIYMGKKIYDQDVRVKGNTYKQYVADFGTVEGKRERQALKTLEAARVAIEKNAILAKRIGRQAHKLDDNDLLDAATALDILQRRVALETAAKFYMTHNHPVGGKKTISEAVDEFIKSRMDKGCRPVTVKGYADKLLLFKRDIPDRQIAQVTLAVLEKWFQSHNYGMETRKSYLRTIRAFFQWAQNHRYVVGNPARSIDMPKVDKKRVVFLSVSDAKRLLSTTASERPELVPYVALGLFAGLRPSEIHGEFTGHAPLDWRFIDFDKKLIDLELEQTKTRDGRHVAMSANLIEWILPYRREHGPIFYTRSAFLEVLKKSGIPYVKDVMRHTFGTMHWAMHRNEGETAIQMGDTIKTVKNHYVNPRAEQAEAEKFWRITPAGKSIIPFGAEAG